MNMEQYYKSLSEELCALKNRVRNYINDTHWLTDGEWKETVIRTILRRNLPNYVGVSRGFIITPYDTSRQIDVLVYDQRKPIPFREGDLAFVTPDTALLVAEVKTKITIKNFKIILNKLADNAEKCRVHLGQNISFSLFSYEEDNLTHERVLNALRDVSESNIKRIINFIALGPNKFYRFWDMDPLARSRQQYKKWHAYSVQNLAFGYFINNIISEISPEIVHFNRYIWFPTEGKEPYLSGEMQFIQNI